MKLDSFLKELSKKGIDFAENEPMSRHTTFKIGGNADVLVTVKSTDELCFVLSAANKMSVPAFILGRGSNLLVSDSGIEGAVISLSGMDYIKAENNEIICGAGAPLLRVCLEALEKGLSGLEFAYGIPGSMGGALYMNAGAYGGEMSQAVKSAKCVDKSGKERIFKADEMQLGYRTSIFKKSEYIITEVTLTLQNGNAAEIKEKMDDFMCRRRDKQPLEFPSAGSTFKRPEGYFAGALIEKNGLKGAFVGDAEVSVKHAGFVINKGSATFEDVSALIKKIQDTVFENDGIRLETEVISVGKGI